MRHFVIVMPLSGFVMSFKLHSLHLHPVSFVFVFGWKLKTRFRSGSSFNEIFRTVSVEVIRECRMRSGITYRTQRCWLLSAKRNFQWNMLTLQTDCVSCLALVRCRSITVMHLYIIIGRDTGFDLASDRPYLVQPARSTPFPLTRLPSGALRSAGELRWGDG